VVVYLFTDADDQPVQLLASKTCGPAEARLGGDELIGHRAKSTTAPHPARSIGGGSIAPSRQIWFTWRSRAVFPQSIADAGVRVAWFVHVNRQPFPRYVKTTHLGRDGVLIGPLEDKHAAARLIAWWKMRF